MKEKHDNKTTATSVKTPYLMIVWITFTAQHMPGEHGSVLDRHCELCNLQTPLWLALVSRCAVRVVAWDNTTACIQKIKTASLICNSPVTTSNMDINAPEQNTFERLQNAPASSLMCQVTPTARVDSNFCHHRSRTEKKYKYCLGRMHLPEDFLFVCTPSRTHVILFVCTPSRTHVILFVSIANYTFENSCMKHQATNVWWHRFTRHQHGCFTPGKTGPRTQ